MKLWSDSWSNGERIPARYACGRLDGADGAAFSDNVNPHLGLERAAGGDAIAGPDLPRLRRAEPRRRRQPGRARDPGRPAARRLLPLAARRHAGQRARDRGGRVQPRLHAARQAGSGGHGAGLDGARQGINDFTGWFAGNPELAGDYFGYDGPFPPWNDSLDPPLRVHALRARRSRARRSRAASPAPSCARRSTATSSPRPCTRAPTRSIAGCSAS